MDVKAYVHGLADGIAVGAVALRIGQAVEVVPRDEIVGIEENAALAHPDVLDPFLRERVGELDVLKAEEGAVLQEEGVGALVVTRYYLCLAEARLQKQILP